MTEEQVLEAINKTVSYLSPSFKFGYYDVEDMKQEGTIFCIEALPQFNFSKSCQDDIKDALATFLKKHVRRKQLTRSEPPSCDCELCVRDSHNRLDCKKYSNWVKRNISKKSLMEPFDVDSMNNSDASFLLNFEDHLLSSDILSILDEHIPSSIRVEYRKFIDGASISKQKKERLIKEIKIILKEKYSKEIP